MGVPEKFLYQEQSLIDNKVELLGEISQCPCFTRKYYCAPLHCKISHNHHIKFNLHMVLQTPLHRRSLQFALSYDIMGVNTWVDMLIYLDEHKDQVSNATLLETMFLSEQVYFGPQIILHKLHKIARYRGDIILLQVHGDNNGSDVKFGIDIVNKINNPPPVVCRRHLLVKKLFWGTVVTADTKTSKTSEYLISLSGIYDSVSITNKPHNNLNLSYTVQVFWLRNNYSRFSEEFDCNLTLEYIMPYTYCSKLHFIGTRHKYLFFRRAFIKGHASPVHKI